LWVQETALLAKPTALGCLVVVALAAAACGRSESGLYAERSTVIRAPVAAPATYVGRWARTAEDCRSRAFTFTSHHLQAPSGASCDVSRVEASLAGYSLSTVCRIDGATIPGRLLLTVPTAGAGRALTVEGGPLDRPLGLTRCPDTTEVAAAEGAG
jgi:hypothetical protein